MTVEASESIVAGSTNGADKPPRTLVVRMVTPGTTGNDFGLYVRARDSKINPSVDVAPSKSWFAQSDPYLSNPYSPSDPKFGQVKRQIPHPPLKSHQRHFHAPAQDSTFEVPGYEPQF